jgi:hypothetical protein
MSKETKLSFFGDSFIHHLIKEIRNDLRLNGDVPIFSPDQKYMNGFIKRVFSIFSVLEV